MEQTPSYTVRKSLFEKPAVHSLTDDGILITEEGRQKLFVPFRDITSIGLYYKPSRFNTNNYACKISYRNFSYTFFSVNYKSFGDFENLNTTYNPFVKEIVNRAKSMNPAVKIYAGQPLTTYWVQLAVVVFTFLFLIAVLAAFPIPGGLIILLRFLILGYLTYYVIKMFKKNYPKEITNLAIPDKVLPVVN